ncbi:MAG: exosortase-associated EpsI family protein [Lacipirellulaceae bacterium]
MFRSIPVVLAVLAIVVLTVVEGSISDRWVDVNREATYAAMLLEEVPSEIGPWVGVDQTVDDDTQRVAGAEGFVSRTYTNKETEQQVSVWLIVGHARDTAQHAPDVCYPSAGFTQKQANESFPLEIEGQPPMKLWTGMFVNSNAIRPVSERVFWTWFRPSADSAPAWEAPKRPRWHFGSTRALFKLYFTARTEDAEEKADQSVALNFAREFLPVANPIITKSCEGAPQDFDADKARAEVLAKQAKRKETAAAKAKSDDA